MLAFVVRDPHAGARALACALREQSCPLEFLLLEDSTIGNIGGALGRCTPRSSYAERVFCCIVERRSAKTRTSARYYAVPSLGHRLCVRLTTTDNCLPRPLHAGIALALALIENAEHSSLHMLVLDSCGLGDAAATALGAALAAQERIIAPVRSSLASAGSGCRGGLRELAVRHNESIGQAGAFALAEGIRQAGEWFEGVDVTGVGAAADRPAVQLLIREAAEAWSLRHSGGGGGRGVGPKKALSLTLPP